ncbi:CHCH-like protein [Artemisia annua]|uniref:CHCH-like protein n=1 Tax=Artemisia annua TaxID=35608 RepID=A0A2U1P8W3_ARTAN|nr:CHCH-like protein [Artemisia annua]
MQCDPELDHKCWDSPEVMIEKGHLLQMYDSNPAEVAAGTTSACPSKEKGSDCVQPFVTLQKCIQTNPTAFPKDVLEKNETEVVPEKSMEDYKIIPLRWAVDSLSPSPRQKL